MFYFYTSGTPPTIVVSCYVYTQLDSPAVITHIKNKVSILGEDQKTGIPSTASPDQLELGSCRLGLKPLVAKVMVEGKYLNGIGRIISLLGITASPPSLYWSNGLRDCILFKHCPSPPAFSPLW